MGARGAAAEPPGVVFQAQVPSVPDPNLSAQTAPGAGWRSASWRWLAALLALALARGALYTFVVPPWQHPDEPTHFEHVRAIAETRRVVEEDYVSLPARRQIAESMLRHGFWRGIEQPPLDDANLAAVGSTPIGIYTYTQPRLYYVAAALWLLPWLGLPVDGQLYAVRAFAVLLNLVVVACVYLSARLVLPARPALALGAAGFVALHPMHTDIMAAANNDALVNALSGLFFLVVAQAYRAGWAWWTTPAAFGALVGGVVAKTSGVMTAAAAPLALLCYPWGRRANWLTAFAVLLLAGAGLCLAAVVLSGAAASTLSEWAAAFGRYTRIQVEPTLQALVGLERPAFLRASAVVVFRSFWAAFGWRHVLLADGWYWWPGLATLGAGAGLAAQAGRAWLRRGRAENADAVPARYLLFSAGAVLVAWGVAIARSHAVQGPWVYHSHGRYAFVAMAPFALLLTTGLFGWLPEAWQRRGLWVFLALWAGFDALAFWGFLVPYYYGPR